MCSFCFKWAPNRNQSHSTEVTDSRTRGIRGKPSYQVGTGVARSRMVPRCHPYSDQNANISSNSEWLAVVEGSLEAKLPTTWRDENAGQLGSSSDMEKVRREKMQVREKVGKSRNTVFFQCFVAPEGRKVGSLKRRLWR